MKNLNKIIKILKDNEIDVVDKQITKGNDVILTSENVLFLYDK